jgi:hypothetical protein
MLHTTVHRHCNVIDSNMHLSLGGIVSSVLISVVNSLTNNQRNLMVYTISQKDQLALNGMPKKVGPLEASFKF